MENRETNTSPHHICHVVATFYYIFYSSRTIINGLRLRETSEIDSNWYYKGQSRHLRVYGFFTGIVPNNFIHGLSQLKQREMLNNYEIEFKSWNLQNCEEIIYILKTVNFFEIWTTSLDVVLNSASKMSFQCYCHAKQPSYKQ